MSYAFMKILESAPRRYDRGINILYLGHIDRIKNEIIRNWILPRDDVLEIGCGTATLSILCAERGARVFSFDSSPQMLSIARQKVKDKGLTEQIKLMEMGVVQMDRTFVDGEFDKVVSTLVFSELYAEEQGYALKEAYRVLKPGGLLILADEVRPKAFLKRIAYLIIRIPLTIITYILTQTTTKAVKDIEDRIIAAGFKVVSQERSLFDSFETIIAKKEG